MNISPEEMAARIRVRPWRARINPDDGRHGISDGICTYYVDSDLTQPDALTSEVTIAGWILYLEGGGE